MWKELAVFSKLRYTCVEAFLVLFHPMFFWFWRYQNLNEIFLVWLAKLFRTGPEFCWSRNVSLKKIKFVIFLCTLGKRFSNIGQKLFRQCSRLCIVRVQDNILDGNFIWKKSFLFFLWHWVTKVQTFSSISLACFYWRSFYVSKKLERRQQNRKKLRFYSFFGVFERKIYALWPKSLRQCFQNCVLPSQRKALEENVFKKIFFHAFTRSFSGKVSYFEWKLFACFSKLHPTFIEAFQ